jgi:2-polyprenyl-3-methyl-5-hydroxy-6-metoxy-1,4-benzoquinol methylase
MDRSCWCEANRLVRFSEDYKLCKSCHTLVEQKTFVFDNCVNNDDEDFYGKNYWFSHQKELGFPDILQRARSDLPERCAHWLSTLLSYKLPSAKVLELGSAHGGFVAMLNWAGYDAMGLDLSPWAVNFAKKTFDIPMLHGPIEQQKHLEKNKLDVIILMDVLEHLPNPRSTMKHCLKLLKLDGILVIQMPNYPKGMDYVTMQVNKHPFISQLKVRDHLYLFSQYAALEFFRQLGANYIEFEPAIFSHYDMFLLVSKCAFQKNSPAQIEKALSVSAQARLVMAILDAYQFKLKYQLSS